MAQKGFFVSTGKLCSSTIATVYRTSVIWWMPGRMPLCLYQSLSKILQTIDSLDLTIQVWHPNHLTAVVELELERRNHRLSVRKCLQNDRTPSAPKNKNQLFWWMKHFTMWTHAFTPLGEHVEFWEPHRTSQGEPPFLRAWPKHPMLQGRPRSEAVLLQENVNPGLRDPKRLFNWEGTI